VQKNAPVRPTLNARIAVFLILGLLGLIAGTVVGFAYVPSWLGRPKGGGAIAAWVVLLVASAEMVRRAYRLYRSREDK
jgi:hypothetical protein